MTQTYCPFCLTPVSGTVCTNCGHSVHYDSSPHRLPVGTVLSSGKEQHYRVGAALGQGGFGITYVALHLESGQRVAIKEYFPSRCARRLPDGRADATTEGDKLYESGMDSFLKEAGMLAGVDPLPSVVHVLDFFQTNGTAYLVMEYLDGMPLHQKLAKEGKIPAEVLMPRLPALLRDLSLLHQAGVIHRDISPDNLMWMPDGTLKLLDFGSARSMEDGRSMTVMLKHGFAPVEQYQTRGQGAWTDVYAMAATIYYCLTGVIPPTAVERLDNDTLRPPTQLGAALTPEEEQALLWGLEVQPRSRPANMELFAARFLQSMPANAERTVGQTQEQAVDQPADQTVVHTQVQTEGQTISQTQVGTEGDTEAKTEVQEPPKTPALLRDKRKLLLLAILAAAAVACLIFYLQWRGSRGVLGDFSYVIQRDGVHLTDYNGWREQVDVPDTIRDRPVTVLEDELFAGEDKLTQVTLPEGVTQLGDDLFRGCSGLQVVVLPGEDRRIEAPYDLFDGCDQLRGILADPGVELDVDLPEGCRIYETDQVDEVGKLTKLVVGEEQVLYGLTDQEWSVLLHVPAGITELELPEAVEEYTLRYLAEGSIADPEGMERLALADNCYFPYSMMDTLTDISTLTIKRGSLARDWVYSCFTALAINELRGSGKPQAEPYLPLVELAQVRAQELTEKYSSLYRPDGQDWETIQREYDEPFSYMEQEIDLYGESEDNGFLECIVESAPSFVDEVSKGGYVTKVGAAEAKEVLYYLAFLGTVD